MSALEILKDARDLLDGGRSWIKGSYSTTLPGGRKAFCAIGAVNHAAYGEPLPPWQMNKIAPETQQNRAEALVALADAMGRPVALGVISLADSAGGNVVHWNDLGNRTASEVVAAFDRAIEELTLPFNFDLYTSPPEGKGGTA